MRKITFLVSSIFAICAFQPALADWNYTKWGMTPEQVVQSSKGKVQLFDGGPAGLGGPIERARGSVPVGNDVLQASFYFSETGLSEVVLNSSSVSVCSSVVNELNGKYGTVDASGRMGDNYAWARWRSDSSNSWVDLTSMDPSCRVQYTPLTTQAGSSL